MNSLIEFETPQPFATRFLTQALATGHLVNAYIFQGRDMGVMYRMALRLAQVLNCQSRPDITSACGACQNCRWISENAHPGVITLTNLTYLVSFDPETGTAQSKTGKPQKQLVVDQFNSLLHELAMHSGGFHRVVVLAGAQETPAPGDEQALPFTPPRDWKPQQEGGQFGLLPLDRRLFPDVLANKFLKTLEEPPNDVVFFLLTDAEDKLLETIVSRCQRIPFSTPPDFYRAPLSSQARQTFGQVLAMTGQDDFLKQSHTLLQYADASGQTLDAVLLAFEAFVWEQWTHHPEDNREFSRVCRMLRQLEQAQRMIQAKVRDEAVLEDLFLQLAHNTTAS